MRSRLPRAQQPVNSLVAKTGCGQPQVSKHLRILREVGLVRVRDEGRERIYRLNGRPLKPIHDWLRRYEQGWNDSLDALDDVLDDLTQKGERR